MIKHYLIFLFLVILTPSVLLCQSTDEKINLGFETRFDYTLKVPSEKELKTTSSFDGKFLNIFLKGNINNKFSYNYRQRLILDGYPNYQSFFNATDWMYLTYKINNNFYVSGGKEVVAIGGYEYDAAPIDQYFWTDFWNNIICYQLGVSGGYISNDNNHNIKFQITNSPFSTKSLQGIYAYNLIWYGNFNYFKTIYSLNRLEYEKDNFINYIALGNKFKFDNLSFELDLMSRFGDKQKNLFTDYTVNGTLAYLFLDKINLFVKAGYDENSSQDSDVLNAYDRVVLPGTKYFFYGSGVEFFPINKSKNVRLHGYLASNNIKPQYLTINFGVSWKMNVLNR